MSMQRYVAVVLVLAGGTAAAQEPTAADAKSLLEAFRSERTDAAQRYSAEAFVGADGAAARAEKALAANDPKAAARFARDARWQLPYTPPGLPAHVLRVIGANRLKHAEQVNALAYDRTGRRLVSASKDGTARVWDLANGAELLAYRGHPEPPVPADPNKADKSLLKVCDVDVSPDGTTVASAGLDGVHLWNLDTGKLIRILPIKGKQTHCLAFSPDGKRLVTGGDDHIIRLWDVEKTKPLFATKPQNSTILGIAFSPKGDEIASVNGEGRLTVLAVKGDKEKLLLGVQVTNPGAAYAVRFSPEGNGLYTCGDDKIPRLTSGPAADGSGNASTASTVRQYIGHAGAVSCLDVTRDGKLLVTGSNSSSDQTVRVWDTATGKALRVFMGHLSGVTAVAIRPDGKEVASADEDGTIRLWPLASADEHKAVTEATDSVWAAAMSPSGSHFATGGADKTVRIYDAVSGKLVHTLTAHKAAVTALAFLSEDQLASASGDRLIKLWDVKTGTFQKDLAGHTSVVLALAATNGGRTLISGSVDKSVKGWDPATGKPVWSLTGKSAVCATAATADGKRVAVGTADGWLTLLEPTADTAKELAAVAAHTAGVSGVAFSADGRRILTCGGDGAAKIWTVADDAKLTLLLALEQPVATTPNAPPPAPLSAAVFSPDGKLVAAAGADGVVRLWDALTGRETRSLRGHTDWVTALAFAPDGRGLLAASVDKTARLFELSKSDAATVTGHVQMVRAVAVSPDGKRIATGSSDKTVRIWDLDTGKELAVLTGSTDLINTLTFADQDTVVVGGEDQRVRWFSVSTGKELRATSTGRVFTLVPTPDGKKVAVWNVPPNVDIPPITSNYDLLARDGSPMDSLLEKGRKVSCATFSPDATWVLTGSPTGTIRIWDLKTKKPVGDDWPVFQSYVVDLGITRDKKTLVSVDETGTVKVADVAGRKVTASAKAHDKGVNGLIVAKGGGRFATVGADNVVKVFDMSAKELRTWKLPTVVNTAAFSPDGKQLVTANGDGTAYVLDVP
ncbi:MAG TPA: hypothetical protein VGJ05_00245 [Fimbriiglobus sp.]